MKILLLSLALLFAFTTLAQPPAYVPTDSLVAWWPFNGNANDESGNGNNGTVYGATLTSDQFGNPNSAYEFTVNGSASWGSAQEYIDVPFSSSFNIDQITCVGWVYPQTKPSPYDDRPLSIFSRWNSSSPNFRFQVGYTNTVQIQLNDFGGGVGLASDDLLVPFDQWSHVASTYDGTICKLYVNGVLVKSDSFGIQLMTGNSNLTIGQTQMTNGNWLYFDGILDELGFWSTALDSCQIKDLYQGSLGNCCTSNPITSQPTDQSATIGNDAVFSFTDVLSGAAYQWQMNDGTGYTNLFNAGQFSGADAQMLTVSAVTMGNNNSLFRCLVTESSNCQDTTAAATLTVIDNTGIEELINTQKELIKIIDFMGRETEFKPNTPLIFIYSDGTRERVMEIEE